MSSASTKTRPYRPGLNPPAPLTFRIIFAGALSVPSTTWLKLEADLSTSLVSERDAHYFGSTGDDLAILRYANVYGPQQDPFGAETTMMDGLRKTVEWLRSTR